VKCKTYNLKRNRKMESCPCDINKKITDIDCCPHCKDDFGYYQKVRTKGAWHDNTLWSGEKENTEMMDSFRDTWQSKYYYCMSCNKKICKV
jgi:hypothetical protein